MAFKLQVTRHVEKKEVLPTKIKLEIVHHNQKSVVKKKVTRKPRQKKIELVESVAKEVKNVPLIEETLPIKKKKTTRVKKESIKISE